MKPKPPHFPYVQHVRSSGNWASYWRKDGERKTIRPRFYENEAAFRAVHAALMAAENSSKPSGPKKKDPYSVEAFVQRYLESADFRALAPLTQDSVRRRLRYLVADYGSKSIAKLTEAAVAKIKNTNKRTDVVVNGMLKALSALARMAVEDGVLDRNPVPGVKKRKTVTRHYLPWPLEICGQFREHWPIGTKQRTAFEIGYHTGQRISDVAAMQWGHIDGPVWRLTQKKTGRTLVLPLWGQLPAVLDASPRDSLFVIGTPRGQRSVKAAPMWFRNACDAAGVPPDFSFHGLRATCAVAAVEAGLTEDEAMSLTGHESPTEFRRYVKSARQEVLVRNAVTKLENRTCTDIVNR